MHAHPARRRRKLVRRGESSLRLTADVLTVTLELVVEPLANVVLAVFMGESPVSCGLPLHPFAFVDEAVGPDLHSLAVLLAPLPFPDVHLFVFADLRRIALSELFVNGAVVGIGVLAILLANVSEHGGVYFDCPVSEMRYFISPWLRDTRRWAPPRLPPP